MRPHGSRSKEDIKNPLHQKKLESDKKKLRNFKKKTRNILAARNSIKSSERHTSTSLSDVTVDNRNKKSSFRKIRVPSVESSISNSDQSSVNSVSALRPKKKIFLCSSSSDSMSEKPQRKNYIYSSSDDSDGDIWSRSTRSPKPNGKTCLLEETIVNVSKTEELSLTLKNESKKCISQSADTSSETECISTTRSDTEDFKGFSPKSMQESEFTVTTSFPSISIVSEPLSNREYLNDKNSSYDKNYSSKEKSKPANKESSNDEVSSCDEYQSCDGNLIKTSLYIKNKSHPLHKKKDFLNEVSSCIENHQSSNEEVTKKSIYDKNKKYSPHKKKDFLNKVALLDENHQSSNEEVTIKALYDKNKKHSPHKKKDFLNSVSLLDENHQSSDEELTKKAYDKNKKHLPHKKKDFLNAVPFPDENHQSSNEEVTKKAYDKNKKHSPHRKKDFLDEIYLLDENHPDEELAKKTIYDKNKKHSPHKKKNSLNEVSSCDENHQSSNEEVTKKPLYGKNKKLSPHKKKDFLIEVSSCDENHQSSNEEVTKKPLYDKNKKHSPHKMKHSLNEVSSCDENHQSSNEEVTKKPLYDKNKKLSPHKKKDFLNEVSLLNENHQSSNEELSKKPLYGKNKKLSPHKKKDFLIEVSSCDENHQSSNEELTKKPIYDKNKKHSPHKKKNSLNEVSSCDENHQSSNKEVTKKPLYGKNKKLSPHKKKDFLIEVSSCDENHQSSNEEVTKKPLYDKNKKLSPHKKKDFLNEVSLLDENHQSSNKELTKKPIYDKNKKHSPHKKKNFLNEVSSCGENHQSSNEEVSKKPLYDKNKKLSPHKKKDFLNEASLFDENKTSNKKLVEKSVLNKNKHSLNKIEKHSRINKESSNDKVISPVKKLPASDNFEHSKISAPDKYNRCFLVSNEATSTYEQSSCKKNKKSLKERFDCKVEGVSLFETEKSLPNSKMSDNKIKEGISSEKKMCFDNKINELILSSNKLQMVPVVNIKKLSDNELSKFSVSGNICETNESASVLKENPSKRQKVETTIEKSRKRKTSKSEKFPNQPVKKRFRPSENSVLCNENTRTSPLMDKFLASLQLSAGGHEDKQVLLSQNENLSEGYGESSKESAYPLDYHADKNVSDVPLLSTQKVSKKLPGKLADKYTTQNKKLNIKSLMDSEQMNKSAEVTQIKLQQRFLKNSDESNTTTCTSKFEKLSQAIPEENNSSESPEQEKKDGDKVQLVGNSSSPSSLSLTQSDEEDAVDSIVLFTDSSIASSDDDDHPAEEKPINRKKSLKKEIKSKDVEIGKEKIVFSKPVQNKRNVDSKIRPSNGHGQDVPVCQTVESTANPFKVPVSENTVPVIHVKNLEESLSASEKTNMYVRDMDNETLLDYEADDTDMYSRKSRILNKDEEVNNTRFVTAEELNYDEEVNNTRFVTVEGLESSVHNPMTNELGHNPVTEELGHNPVTEELIEQAYDSGENVSDESLDYHDQSQCNQEPSTFVDECEDDHNQAQYNEEHVMFNEDHDQNDTATVEHDIVVIDHETSGTNDTLDDEVEFRNELLEEYCRNYLTGGSCEGLPDCRSKKHDVPIGSLNNLEFVQFYLQVLKKEGLIYAIDTCLRFLFRETDDLARQNVDNSQYWNKYLIMLRSSCNFPEYYSLGEMFKVASSFFEPHIKTVNELLSLTVKYKAIYRLWSFVREVLKQMKYKCTPEIIIEYLKECLCGMPAQLPDANFCKEIFECMIKYATKGSLIHVPVTYWQTYCTALQQLGFHSYAAHLRNEIPQLVVPGASSVDQVWEYGQNNDSSCSVSTSRSLHSSEPHLVNTSAFIKQRPLRKKLNRKNNKKVLGGNGFQLRRGPRVLGLSNQEELNQPENVEHMSVNTIDAEHSVTNNVVEDENNSSRNLEQINEYPSCSYAQVHSEPAVDSESLDGQTSEREESAEVGPCFSEEDISQELGDRIDNCEVENNNSTPEEEKGEPTVETVNVQVQSNERRKLVRPLYTRGRIEELNLQDSLPGPSLNNVMPTVETQITEQLQKRDYDKVVDTVSRNKFYIYWEKYARIIFEIVTHFNDAVCCYNVFCNKMGENGINMYSCRKSFLSTLGLNFILYLSECSKWHDAYKIYSWTRRFHFDMVSAPQAFSRTLTCAEKVLHYVELHLKVKQELQAENILRSNNMFAPNLEQWLVQGTVRDVARRNTLCDELLRSLVCRKVNDAYRLFKFVLTKQQDINGPIPLRMFYDDIMSYLIEENLYEDMLCFFNLSSVYLHGLTNYNIRGVLIRICQHSENYNHELVDELWDIGRADNIYPTFKFTRPHFLNIKCSWGCEEVTLVILKYLTFLKAEYVKRRIYIVQSDLIVKVETVDYEDPLPVNVIVPSFLRRTTAHSVEQSMRLIRNAFRFHFELEFQSTDRELVIPKHNLTEYFRK